MPEPGTPPGLGDPANPDTAGGTEDEVRGLTGGDRWRRTGSTRTAWRRRAKLIDAGKYDDDTEWSDAAPSADDENAEIDKHGYDGFGAWHLAIDPDASEETKGRYRFPYGDFAKVNRAALIHAKQRAAQNDHDEIEKAADRLLQHLDEKRDA